MNITAPALLRAAAVLAFVQFVGHGALFFRAEPRHGPAEIAVVEAMRANEFEFGGRMRSYWDMYFGYGLQAAFACLVEAVLLWQLAAIAARDPLVVRPIAVLIAAANLAHIALIARYFGLLLPIAFDSAIVVALVALLIRR